MEIKLNEMSRTKEGDVVEIEGNVKFAKAPMTGQYGVSQWVVIADSTGEQGCWIYLDSEEDKIIKGACIKVSGKVKEFTNKKNQPDKSVNGKVIDEIQKDEDVSQEKPMQSTQETTQKPEGNPKEYTKDDYWHDKTFREIENNKCIVRECAIKAVTEMVGKDIFPNDENFEKEYYKFADRIVGYIYNCKITSEAITKEFGGTATEVKENPYIPKEYKERLEPKEERIAKAKEIVKDTMPGEDLVKNPHLAEPVNDKMATILQKKQIYGYINEEGKKMGGIVDSQYITKEEVKKIGKADKLTKAQGIRYWEYWYGKDQGLGERDKRELEAKEKETSPFVTPREPLEKVDKNDDFSLTKDVLIEKIQELRKGLCLEDNAKFKEKLGYNANFEKWTEKELIRLKDLLKDWKPSWIME